MSGRNRIKARRKLHGGRREWIASPGDDVIFRFGVNAIGLAARMLNGRGSAALRDFGHFFLIMASEQRGSRHERTVSYKHSAVPRPKLY